MLENQENKNLKLEIEMLKIEQEIQKKERSSEEEQKKSTAGWSCFGTFLMLCVITALMSQNDNRWWGGVVVCAFFLIIGLWLGLSSNSKARNINQELEKLKKQKKELESRLDYLPR